MVCCALKTPHLPPSARAPEIIACQRYSLAVDQWSLGVILFVLLRRVSCAACVLLACGRGGGGRAGVAVEGR